MEPSELAELLTHLRNSGRASAYDAIAAFAKALRELPPDFAEQLQREADARIASGGGLGPLPKRDLRGSDAREIDRDNVVLVLEDSANSSCTATLHSDLVRFATGAAGKPFVDDVTLEDTIVLDPSRFGPKASRDLGVGATITIVSTAKRGNSGGFDERHDGTISTEFKLTWKARGDTTLPALPIVAERPVLGPTDPPIILPPPPPKPPQ